MKQTIIVLSLICCLFSCEYITEVVDISEKNVSVLAPLNESIINSNEVIFTWDTLEDAEQYKIQIAQPSFLEATQIALDSTVTTTTFSKTLQPGPYEWRLRAENSDYQTVYKTFGFYVDAGTIVDISNTEIVLLVPNNNATFTTTDAIDFSWEAIEGATAYVFEMAIPDFDNPTETIEDETITETNLSVSNLAVGNYQWRVKAENLIYETVYTTQSLIIE
ncbi:MAG: hypothetical protein ABJL44_18450 [Algibacter sp.]